MWRKAADAIALIEAARTRGVDVTADAYPYNAWSSTITVLVPDKRYDYPPSVEKALADVGGAANVLIVRHAAHPEYEFRTLDAVAIEQHKTPVELFIQIVKDGGAGVVCTSMVDEDIRAFYRQPWVMVASDGGIATRHPRGAGTFPRVLGRYVRDQQWLTLPDAIRKMTSAPAARMRLEGRGRIEVGAIADVVLFNAKTVVDRSTFTDPAVLPTGVEKVFVGGELVWDGGKPAAARPGRVLMSGHTPVDTDAGAYRLVPNWGPLPAGMQFGEVPGMTIDAAGRVFAFTRAEPPVIEFDASGKVLKTWGEKMFVWPHGIRVDRNGFLWITDGRARNGIGQQVFKFTRDGQLVMTLGKKGVSGDGPDTFNSPTDVAVAPNGDIFVSDGHVNSRIVKFSKDGRSSRRGASGATAPASSTCRTRSSSTRAAGCWWAIARTGAFRFSIRTDGSSISGRSSDRRAGSSSPRTTPSTSSTTTTRWRCSWEARRTARSGRGASRCSQKVWRSTRRDRSTSGRPSPVTSAIQSPGTP